MLIGSFPTQRVFTIIATVGIVLAALYILLMFQRTMPGPARGGHDATAATCTAASSRSWHPWWP